MKKIFFLLLLFPGTLIAQKNYWHVDSSYKHIHLDTIGVCITKRNTITLVNEVSINMQWLSNIGIMIYPNIEGMYKWDREWNRAMKGIAISY